MRHRLWLIALVACLSLIVTSATTAAPAKHAAGAIYVNGVALKLNQSAYVVNKTTMVPLRQIAEALGANISSGTDDQGRKYAKLTRGTRQAVITVGVGTMVAGSRTVKLGVAPELRSGTIMVPVRAISEALGTVVTWDGVAQVIRIDEPKQLPVIGTQKKLEELLQEIRESNRMYAFHDDELRVVVTAMPEAMPAAAGAGETATSIISLADQSSDYSKTNVQVQGVDEADWAKTDGKFVYQISGTRIFISDISNPNSPKLAATIEYTAADSFYPVELYVDEGRLAVIGQHHAIMPAGNSPNAPVTDDLMRIMPVITPSVTTVKTNIYSLSEDGKPTLVRQTELEGNYVSSRKIDGALYIVANKYNPVYYDYPVTIFEKRAVTGASAPEHAFEPAYGDTAVSPALKRLPLSEIRYFPDAVESNTMLIGALDLDRPDQAFQVSAYLGAGQTIYASTKHLYVAASRTVPSGDSYKQETQLYKFRLDQGNVVYIGEGSVPGTLLNQFSMDEHNGFFRIATTNGNMWDTGANRSTNNLYVLDEQLKTIGSLTDLAPGERIYSVRFMGDRAYMVTFRNVDPLFVIDLRSPTQPAVLGQLKIPGYSDYLHPYDDNHIIGFGKETVELPVKGMGRDELMAFYQGMKIAMFDVTDVANPKELFKEVIGDRGTGSELLGNHKALLFDKSRGLMAFPVELMEIKDRDQIEDGGFPAYGQFVYQGAYVYHVDLMSGFTLRGRITHLSQDDLARSGQYGYDYSKSVRRILYAGNTLYTLSERMLKANDLGSLTERGSISYPASPEQKYYPYSSSVQRAEAAAAASSGTE